MSAPLASSLALLAIAKGYCTASDVSVPIVVQLQTAAVLGASHYVSELGGDGDPLRTAMTTGALYTAILFFLGDRAVVRNGVLGVSLSYIAETSFGKDNAKEADDSDDERRGGDDHIA